jgi:hypothetical protein
MALEPSSEDEAFVFRMTHDSDRWVREDISHTVWMLRKLSLFNDSDGDFDTEAKFTQYLVRHKTFIQARKALDANHPMRKIILKRMAVMSAPLEELLNFQLVKNHLEVRASPGDISGPRQRRGVNISTRIGDDVSTRTKAFSLFNQVGRDLDLLQIYILMDPPRCVQNPARV